jgi:ABC-type sugar transport system permease subunit
MDIKALALSAGIMAAAITLLISLWYSLTGYGAEIIAMMESFYGKMTIIDLEFSKSVPFIQNLWKVIVLSIFSFVDGVIVGSLFAIVYNLFIPKKNEKETK